MASNVTDDMVKASFPLFLLEKWRVSSGEERGDPYSFKDRPYLYDIALDDFWFQVIQKSAQCGVTEFYMARTLWRATSAPGNILYAFPALSQLRQLVGARFRPAIESNAWLHNQITGALNLETIQLGDNTIYFRGVQNRRQIITVDVSHLLVDELDTAVLEASKNNFGNVLYTLEKRLGAAKKPKKYYYSTPSFSGMGINAEFAGDDTNPGSDQREWMVRCRYCRKEQEITWDDNVVDYNEGKRSTTEYAPNVHRVCSACHKEFSAEDILNGKWVPKKPKLSDTCHGYHISKLMMVQSNLNQMKLDSMNPMKEQEFRCSDLGIPFEPKGSKITDEVLERARASNYLMYDAYPQPTCMGIDVGSVLHCMIGLVEDEKIKVIWAGELKDWNEAHEYMGRYSVRFTVVDAQPGGLEQKNFALAHPGRVMAAYYPNYLETTKETHKEKDEVIIHVHRTLSMSMVIQRFFNGQVSLPVDIKGVRDFYKMMKAPVKATQEDVNGNMRTYFPPTRVADHYFHAFVYLQTALECEPKTALFIPKGIF